MPGGCVTPNTWMDLELVGSPVSLVATPILSAKYGNGLILDTDGIYSPGRTVLGSAVFPTSVKDGTEVVYRPQPGVPWTFRYDAGSGTSNKWEFVGGPPVIVKIAGSGNLSPGGGNAWADLSGTSTAGPKFTLPFQGVYGCRMYARVNAAQDGHSCQVGLSTVTNADPGGTPGGGGTGDTDLVISSANVNQSSLGTEFQLPSLAANTQLQMWYRDSASSGTSFYDERVLVVAPVRCQ